MRNGIALVDTGFSVSSSGLQVHMKSPAVNTRHLFPLHRPLPPRRHPRQRVERNAMHARASPHWSPSSALSQSSAELAASARRICKCEALLLLKNKNINSPQREGPWSSARSLTAATSGKPFRAPSGAAR
ncbi:hypothetical protein SRHO_G00223000 [Serrasalmus rhombeus]